LRRSFFAAISGDWRADVNKSRLEAFSDGVIAIIITIMVLELRVPHSTELAALKPLLPVFFSYVLSFVFVAIYWNNHHHLLQAARHVSGPILWANAHLLFWLSLVPFVTSWMGENNFASVPVALYGVVLLCAALAYTILVRALLHHHGHDSVLAAAIGSDFKGNVSLLLYAVAVAMALFLPLVSCVLYATVSVIWLIPDRRIEKRVTGADPH
jgi:uncharacterized membrane protein